MTPDRPFRILQLIGAVVFGAVVGGEIKQCPAPIVKSPDLVVTYSRPKVPCAPVLPAVSVTEKVPAYGPKFDAMAGRLGLSPQELKTFYDWAIREGKREEKRGY